MSVSSYWFWSVLNALSESIISFCQIQNMDFKTSWNWFEIGRKKTKKCQFWSIPDQFWNLCFTFHEFRLHIRIERKMLGITDIKSPQVTTLLIEKKWHLWNHVLRIGASLIFSKFKKHCLLEKFVPLMFHIDLPTSSFGKSLLLQFHKDGRCETHITLTVFVFNSNNVYFNLLRSIYANIKNEGRTLPKLFI
jgi:hypothetical protein